MAEYAVADFLFSTMNNNRREEEEKEEEEGAEKEPVQNQEKQLFELACTMRESLISRLHDAAARNDVDTLRELIQLDPDNLNKPDQAKNTPCHWAAGLNQIDALGLLLDLECDVTAKNLLGDTPLHRAVWRSQRQAVAMLIDRGAIDINSRNNSGHRPIDLARDEEIKGMLKNLVPLSEIQNKSMLVNPEDVYFPSSEEEDSDDDDDDEERSYVDSQNTVLIVDGKIIGQKVRKKQEEEEEEEELEIPEDMPGLEDF